MHGKNDARRNAKFWPERVGYCQWVNPAPPVVSRATYKVLGGLNH